MGQISATAIASPQQLVQAQPGTSVSTLYTAPANDTAVPDPVATTTVTGIFVANTDSAAAQFSLYLVPSGGTAGVANALFMNTSIAANDGKFFAGLGLQMPAGSSLQAVQVTASAITLKIDGVVIQ